MSEHTLAGVSQVTVKNGDTTVFFTVEDLTITANDTEEWIHSYYNLDAIRSWGEPTYRLESANIVLDEDGVAFKVVVKKRPVKRSVEIEVDSFTIDNVLAAREAVRAPEGAEFTKVGWMDEDGFTLTAVRFEWEEEV